MEVQFTMQLLLPTTNSRFKLNSFSSFEDEIFTRTGRTRDVYVINLIQNIARIRDIFVVHLIQSVSFSQGIILVRL